MKPFTVMAIIVFSLVALLQLLRVAMGWELTVAGIFIPLWASVIACVVAGSLAFMVWREARTRAIPRRGSDAGLRKNRVFLSNATRR